MLDVEQVGNQPPFRSYPYPLDIQMKDLSINS